MKKSRLLAAAIVFVTVGMCSVVFIANQVQAATRKIPNGNLTNLSDARKFIRYDANASGYATFIKNSSTTTTILYHPGAGTGWDTVTIPRSTVVLTPNNDGSSDEKNACVDINVKTFDFNTNIWANRGSGCGTNGSTSGGYSGGQVKVDPPNGVPIALFIEDVDGIKDRQHIQFTSSAVQDIFIPDTGISFSVTGGNNLVSNGANGARNCSGQAWCNAIVLLKANSFNIKAGSKDGRSVMRVSNDTPEEYRTLTFAPQGGSFPSNQLDKESDEYKLIREYADSPNLVRDIIKDEESNEFPIPTNGVRTFLGWYENPAGTGNKIDAWSMTNDKTLYAKWGPGITPVTYNLLPAVDAPAIVSVGEQVTFKTSVTNNSSNVSQFTDWAVRKIVVPVGVTVPAGSRTGTSISQFNCGYYQSNSMTCSQLVGDSGSRQFNPGLTPTGIGSPGSPRIAGQYVETMNYPSGSRVCYAVMVNSASEAPKNNYSEAVFCPVVGKSPNLEARNGDVWAGGNFLSASPTCAVADRPVISSSQRQLNGSFYSSYATYGVTSLGLSEHFGSQGMSYDNLVNTPANNLVFGNTAGGGSNVDGFFFSRDSDGVNFPMGVEHCLNDPFDLFGRRIDTTDPASTNSATQIDIKDLGDNTLLNSATTIKLRSSIPIPAGKKIVIYAPNANIDIVSNITYADQPYVSINQIPQVVVMSGKSIVVHWDSTLGGKVTQLDGIYAAKDNIYTCDRKPLLNVCNTPLKINGAVIAGKNVVPLRSAGAETPDYGAMAETFNLRSDVLLNQLPDAGNPTVFIKTVSEREVPPRF